jgi:hypothetical protein
MGQPRVWLQTRAAPQSDKQCPSPSLTCRSMRLLGLMSPCTMLLVWQMEMTLSVS